MAISIEKHDSCSSLFGNARHVFLYIMSLLRNKEKITHDAMYFKDWLK